MIGHHIGRSWPDSGTPIEGACPCPQEPCGLIAQENIDPACEQHRPTKTIRSGHAAEDCPALASTPKPESG